MCCFHLKYLRDNYKGVGLYNFCCLMIINWIKQAVLKKFLAFTDKLHLRACLSLFSTGVIPTLKMLKDFNLSFELVFS